MADHEDLEMACAAAQAITPPLNGSGIVCSPVILAAADFPAAMLAMLRRVEGQEQLQRPAAWWKERSAAVHLDSVYLQGPYGAIGGLLNWLTTLPPDSAVWEQPRPSWWLRQYSRPVLGL